ncbi:uncharacterized protein F4817DRAFT_327445 [Daldinia loculata]|uniref:uncharacterized protein n=1 Tax=Daldinia loculata TaxID=103429 RepID=UPI0020C487EC|nr:uncharacterized protein F4817DRAFT_327445 [Daldinia loculata]KAI1650319.1 hypothetical protein F4817DRAFT_327445 [Daldinia loculata]
MKFTTTISIIAAFCGFAAAAPSPAPASALFPREDCPYGGNWNHCELNGLYVVCVNGRATKYTCDGGCQAICPEGQPCTPRCNNGHLA